MSDTPIVAGRRWLAVRRCPALWAAICFVAGVLLHGLKPRWPGLFVGIGAGLAILTLVIPPRQDFLSNVVLSLSILAAGLAAGQLSAFCYSRDDIGIYAAEEPRLAELELRLSEPPRVIVTPVQSGRRPVPDRQIVRCAALRVRCADRWHEANGNVAVSISHVHPKLVAGQHVRVYGMLEQPAPAMNPGEFDYARYLRNERVLASLHVSHVENIQILETGFGGLLNGLREKTRHLLDRGFDPGRSVDHSVLRALVLGDHDAQMADVQDDFARTGTAHLLAISGLHVAILAACIYMLCRCLFLHPRTAAIVCMSAVVLYALAATPSVAVARAAMMCVILLMGSVIRRTLSALQLLGLAALLMLIYAPMDVYSAGFQLSFMAVLGLVLGARHVELLFGRQESEFDRLTRPRVQLTRRQRWTKKLLRKPREMLSAGIVAWVVTAPLVCLQFDQVNPYAVLMGVLMVFPVFAALVAGFVKIGLTLLLPSLSHQWAVMAAWPVSWMRHLVDWLARLPGAEIGLAPPGVWVIIVYYVVVGTALALAVWWNQREKEEPPPSVPGGGAAQSHASPLHVGLGRWALIVVMLAAPLLLAVRGRAGRGEMRLTLLSVGAGQCGVLELPSGGTFLIDAGSSTVTDVSRKILVPYLRHNADRSIDGIVLSHPDFDHIGAAGEMADRFGKMRVMISPLFRQQSRRDGAAQEVLSRLKDSACTFQTISGPGRVQLDDETVMEVLWPGREMQSTNRNNTGLVLRITCRGRSILMPADIQAEAEAAMISAEAALKSDVLVAPHHGSAEVTTADFVRAVDPSLVLSSNAHRLSHKQLEFDRIVEGRRFYRTDRWGAVTVVVDRIGKLNVRTFLDKGRE